MNASAVQRGGFSLLLAGVVALGACRTKPKPKAQTLIIADVPMEESAFAGQSDQHLSKPAPRPPRRLATNP